MCPFYRGKIKLGDGCLVCFDFSLMNSVGLRIGISMSENDKLSKMCNDALNAGKLKVIKK